MLNNQIKTVIASIGVLISGTSFPLLCGQTVNEFYDVAQESTEDTERYKRIADQFYVDGEYSKAIHYYKLFRQTSKGKPAELVDAYKALIAGYINESDVVSAQIELQNYIIDCSPSIAELDFFNAECLRIQGLFADAIPLYYKSLESLRSTNELYFSVLNGLAFSFEKMKNWGKAKIVYGTIVDESKIDIWRIRAYKQRLFALLMLEEYDQIEAALSTPPVTLETADTVELELFNIFLMTKKNKLDEAAESYKQIREHVSSKSYHLCYKVAMEIAALQQKENMLKESVEYLRDAYTYALTGEERQIVLHSTFNTYLSLDDIDSAIKTAERFIRYYHSSDDAPEMTLKLARLKVRVKKPDEALALYKSLYERSFADNLIRVAAARESAMLFMEQAEYDSADKIINLLSEIAVPRSTIGEAKFLAARVLLLRGLNKDAYKAFVVIAEKFPEWREQSLYQSMIAAYNERDYSTLNSVASVVITEFADSEATQDAYYFKAIAHNKTGKTDKSFNELILFTNKYPKNKFYVDALIAVADIAFRLQKYRDAVVLYTRVVNSSKDKEQQAASLYRRSFSQFYLGDIAKADADFLELATAYPDSKYAYNGLQWLVDYYISAREFAKADTVLEQTVARYVNDKAIVAQAMLQRAVVAKQNNDAKNAVGFADAVIADYSDQPAYFDALNFRGGIYSDGGEFEKAHATYSLLFEKSDDQFVKNAAQGRIADCEIALYSDDFDKERIIAAISRYQNVLASVGLSREFRIETLFKLGKAYELYGNEAKAKELYEELIADFKSAPLSDALWCVKAVNNLSSLLLNTRNPEAAQEAIQYYRSLVKMNIQPVEDYKQEIAKIKKQFNL